MNLLMTLYIYSIKRSFGYLYEHVRTQKYWSKISLPPSVKLYSSGYDGRDLILDQQSGSLIYMSADVDDAICCSVLLVTVISAAGSDSSRSGWL